MSEKIPTVLLCGFLGAGKTTLLSRLVTHKNFSGKKIAVLINEFGKLHIDAALLPQGDYHVAEINKGSIFCVCVKTDLLTTLEDIARNIKPDILFIESTGAAEPGDFTSLLQTEFLQTAYRKASVICVADAVNFLKLQTMLPALTAQVQTADIILINKIDAADPETIKKTEEKITELNPGAKILRTTHGNMDLEDLDIINFQTRNTARLSGDLKEVPPAQTFSCELRNENSVDKKSFYEFMHNYRNSILRGKGLVNFGNDKLFVEIVNGNISSRPASAVKFNASTPVAMSLVLRNITGLEFNHQFQKVFNKNP